MRHNLIFSSWNAYANLMNLTKPSIALSSISDRGQRMLNALVIGGRGRHLQNSGGRLFNYWLNLRGYLPWSGLPSRLSHTKREGDYRT
jgi:hypothetical protein